MGETKRKKLTPEEKLKQKISTQFDKKFFLGDIAISDEEYPVLLFRAKVLLRSMIRSGKAYNDSKTLTLLLVQIGIRFYDGSLWPHIEREVGCTLRQKQREILSDTVLNTLRCHGKYILSGGGCVQTVLLHGFVSNYYSKGLFELLFQYYAKDLERNIYRNTPEQMQALMDTLSRQAEQDESASEFFIHQFMETGSRAYKLRRHTLQAISIMPTHSRARLRRLLRLIDRAFWKDAVPKNPVSRLTILFKEWVSESPAFRHEYRLYQQGEIRNRGKKHFSAPYLFAHIQADSFELRLPAQIVPEACADTIQWEIQTEVRTFRLPADTYPALTGYKTEEVSAAVSQQELFGKIRCQLVSDQLPVRKFPDIPRNTLRFFDMDGDFAARLFKIPMCAYSQGPGELKSSALIDRIQMGSMTRWDFEFEKGDLVILPDGSGMIVGDLYTDGFIPRGKVENVRYVDEDGSHVPVYAKYPELLLTIPASRLPGTEICVDDRRYALSDCRISEFDTKDSKGMRAILLSLSQFASCIRDGLHSVIVDVPGKTYAASFSYVYIRDFSVVFGDAPYLFEEKGTAVFPEKIQVQADCERIHGENGFQLELNSGAVELPVLVNQQIPLQLQIPLVTWSTDKKTWHTEAMGEIWHTEFFRNSKLYFRGPGRKLWLSTNTDAPDDEDAEERVVAAEEGQDGILTVDLTRFRSWLTRDIVRNEVLVKFGKQEKLFAAVYTRSIVASFDVHADYEKEELLCICDTIGKSSYYLDVIHEESGRKLADRQLIENGKLGLRDQLSSGLYLFTVYEAEEDDSGFDDPVYEEIYSVKKQLTNVHDVSGQMLEIRKFKVNKFSNLYTEFGPEYYAVNLKKIGYCEYEASLLINRVKSDYQLHIFFPDSEDLRFFNVTFWHEEEELFVPFLYDRKYKTMVRDEAGGLTASERYRRYSMLDDDKYIFFGILCDTLPPYEKRESEQDFLEWREKHQTGVPIEQMGLSVRTYNALKRSDIRYSSDLDRKTKTELLRIRNLGMSSVKEIIQKSKEYGYVILDNPDQSL